MSIGVDQIDWIITGVRVAVEALRVFTIWHNGISTYEAADAGQVVAGVHVDEAQVVVVAVVGVAAVGDGVAGAVAV